MPSKKRKYNARFPAGRIKKIMQTDEEVGKVAQAVPIIISPPRTLELFVESLLSKALQVTSNRNAKTLSPSHVKQCILAESRFDFLRDLVKNIPDVSAAEEKELMSAESSPTSARVPEAPSNCDRLPPVPPPFRRAGSIDPMPPLAPRLGEEPNNVIKIEPLLLTGPRFDYQTPQSPTEAIDLTKRPVRTANFYQETLPDEHKSVIKLNPTYSSPQPSTSFTTLTPVPALHKIDIPRIERQNSVRSNPRTPVAPVINIDFTKNIAIPEIKVLDNPKDFAKSFPIPDLKALESPKDKVKVSRQNSKSKIDVKKIEIKPIQPIPVDIDSLNSGNLQIDEDYDT